MGPPNHNCLYLGFLSRYLIDTVEEVSSQIGRNPTLQRESLLYAMLDDVGKGRLLVIHSFGG